MIKALLCLLTLCAPQTAGAQTTEELVKEFRNKTSTAEKVEVLVRWARQHGDNGIDELLVQDAPAKPLSDRERIAVTKTLLSYLSIKPPTGGAATTALPPRDGFSVSSFDTVVAMVNTPEYKEVTQDYVSAIKVVVYEMYLAMEPSKRPERVVKVTLGNTPRNLTVHLYFFLRIVNYDDGKVDWAVEMIIPHITPYKIPSFGEGFFVPS